MQRTGMIVACLETWTCQLLRLSNLFTTASKLCNNAI